jgi:hypothetical protein
MADSEIRLKGHKHFQDAHTDNKGFMHTKIGKKDVIIDARRVSEVRKKKS